MSQAPELDGLLRVMRERGASDLHLAAGAAPRLRIDGELVPLDAAPLTAEDVERLCGPALEEWPRRALDESGEVSVALDAAALGRFRLSLFRRRGALGAVLRAVPTEVPPLHRLGLPPVVEALCDRPRGLVLVTGPTGSGRSTTLAAMIDHCASTRRRHIVTVEGPVEHVHDAADGLVSQRELGSDTRTVARAVAAALRQDPDVVAIGDLADADAADAALTAAEAGHLCLAAARGPSVVQALARIVDLFPAFRQSHVRARLAQAVEAVISQRLVPCATGGGRVLATELLVPGTAARAVIRDDNLPALYAQLQAGPAAAGLQTMNRCLADLYLAGRITLEAAVAQTADSSELQHLIASGARRP